MTFICFLSRTRGVVVGVCMAFVGLQGCSKQPSPPAPVSAATTNDDSTTGTGQPAKTEQPTALDAAAIEPASPEDTSGLNSRALLVGCTTYDHLGEQSALRGCGNDVKMMRQVLKDRYGFKYQQIHTLVEGGSADDRPTKANIVRELDRLATESQRGDRVVILLSGHGSQQPNNDPENPDDPEPDGLDELFCPADIDFPKDPDSPFARNALTDDELRVALLKIRQRGAFVWVIVDACHSGSGVRGTEVYRQIPPERLVGQAALQAALRKVPTATRGTAREEQSGGIDQTPADEKLGGLVAIYAAQPHEPTLETMLPRGNDDAEWRGLLSYTMLKVLMNAETPLTYRELVQRIHTEYIESFGRLRPTPLIEGLDQNLEVLGQSEIPPRSQFVLSKEGNGPLTVNAGRLQGCAKGTVFAVFPPSGNKASAQPLGYVRSEQAQLTMSLVAPAEYQTVPANTALPLGGRCEPVEIQYGNLMLNVVFDDQGPGGTEDKTALIPELLQQIEKEPAQRVHYTTDAAQADWIVRRLPTGEVHLLPAEGWSNIPGETHFGPAPIEGRLDWLRDRLGRIARVKSLLKLGDTSSRQRPGGLMQLLGAQQPCDVRLQLLSVLPDSDDAQPINWAERQRKLNDGEQVLLQIQNAGSESIDFTVLFIDSKYGITPLFPPPGVVADNRIEPGQKYSVGPMQVEASSLGLEHLFVIATKAEGQPQNFAWLGQDSLDAVRAATRGVSNTGLKNPLGELFSQVLYSKQNVRGIRMADTESTCLRSISWQTVKTAAPKAESKE